MSSSTLSVKSPMQGRIVALSEVPDPMFALGMMGDGVAIEPTSGEVRAPCDGNVISVHRRGHLVRLMSDAGAEILVHVGLEVVALRGSGLVAHVQVGQRVKQGEPLITFDADALREECGIITSPILVANETGFELSCNSGGDVDFNDEIMNVKPAAKVDGEPPSSSYCDTVTLELKHALHARPAAFLSSEAKKYDSTIEIRYDGRKANAKSPVSLLTLGCHWGSKLEVCAEGEDAKIAVEGTVAAIASGLGDPVEPYTADAPIVEIEEAAPVDTTPFGPDDALRLSGVAAAPGLAIGKALHLAAQQERPAEAGAGAEQERSRLNSAIATLLAHLQEQARTGRTEQQRDIMQAHAALLEDPDLLDDALEHIGQGKSAGWAWSETIQAQIKILRGLDNARLAERAADLVDLEQQMLTVLAGGTLESASLAEGTIIVADDLLPSQFMAFGDQLPEAIVLARGGRTSHVAILSASSGVPMMAAVGPDALRISDGTDLIIDSVRGEVMVNPAEDVIEKTKQQAIEREARREANLAHAMKSCVMADGTRLPVYANIGSVADAERGRVFGAEGSGLLRTEFLFLERMSAPTEAEQLAEYQAITDELEDLPLTIRTLDIGGDKPIAYIKQAQEENPILGIRGIRVCQRYPEILRSQFRAILKVNPVSNLRVMLPMVADVSELRWAKAIFEEEKAALGVTAQVPLGIMIEVPSAVALADRLAREADFFSIGTNDLTQYVLAMDRGNTELAPQIDGLHPAVLRMIAQTTKAAKPHDRPVGVCGGLASELPAAPILIGLGVSSLSATRSGIPDLKAFVRTLDMKTCREVANKALDLDSADDVRDLIDSYWPNL